MKVDSGFSMKVKAVNWLIDGLVLLDWSCDESDENLAAWS